ncbi:MAG: 3-deoxy-7-phosphoheptulonate synthase [Desulfamplus sp.]|nr:3-deoxy-7-phosphoheptulonate synthase [Desulfamplus sp.]
MKKTYDVNVESFMPLMAPEEFKNQFPMPPESEDAVVAGREEIKNILSGNDRRLMVITGPCSVHDEAAAIEYAERLCKLREKVKDSFCIVMRVYFEKPRTTIGWKGLINDPYMDDSRDVMEGLRRARKLLISITSMGLPTATELLDPIIPQFIDGLICWAAIGARTTESQTHREMSSGLSMPVGFKNTTDGALDIAINSMVAAKSPQSFLGIDPHGKVCVVKTKGNPYAHIVLRGGKRPNYDSVSIRDAVERLKKLDLSQSIIVDCSHANSGKKCEGQAIVWDDVIGQYLNGNSSIKGLMLESNICEGNQSLSCAPENLKYGVSVTDECISWETTEELILKGHRRIGKANVSL